jgi:hypothetical protein
MNHGRLLEVGNPNDLYAQPATRFVATFLGRRQPAAGPPGCGRHPLRRHAGDAEGAEPMQAGREHEVVAVLRPEEVEIAATREQLSSNYIARAPSRKSCSRRARALRVRLLDEPCAAQLLGPSGEGDARLEITRTQHERRSLPLVAGRADRHRRTPAARAAHAAVELPRLRRHRGRRGRAARRDPLLESLSTRMKTPRRLRAIDGLPGTPAPFAGVAAIAGGPEAAPTVEWLLRHGAAEVLVLPRNAPSPTRVFIHWTDEAARRATLAVAASLLRHVSAEAVYLGIVPRGRPGSGGRRRCARCSTRAPKRSRPTVSRCARNSPSARPSPSSRATCPTGSAQMLVLGITDVTQAGSAYRSLLAAQPGWPVLIVYRPAEDAAPADLVASGTAA